MPLTLEEAILRVPQWANADHIRTTPLGGGITNHNYRIDVGEDSFVLRIPGEDTELLGINRENEYAANLAAGRLGLAPEVYYFIRPEGYLITRFIAGRPIPPEEITQLNNIERVVNAMRQIHGMEEIPGRFNAFKVVKDYTAVAHRYGVEFPTDYDKMIERVNEAEEALKSHAVDLCPCHNDLLNANFLTNEKLYILDWEYAGMGDRFFDLANFSGNHTLTDAQDRLMLEYYFGEKVSPRHLAYLKIMKIMSDMREASWGLVQIGISKLDFDFREYANKFFSRVMQNINNPNWNEWLKEVSKNV